MCHFLHFIADLGLLEWYNSTIVYSRHSFLLLMFFLLMKMFPKTCRCKNVDMNTITATNATWIFCSVKLILSFVYGNLTFNIQVLLWSQKCPFFTSFSISFNLHSKKPNIQVLYTILVPESYKNITQRQGINHFKIHVCNKWLDWKTICLK